MKKFLLLLLGVLLTLPSFAYDFLYWADGYNQLAITILDEEAKTCKIDNSETKWNLHGELTIPSTVTNEGKEYTITTIGDYAFAECWDLIFVDIPNTVTTIGEYAFSICISLTSVKLPNSIIHIGSEAFWGCDSLTSIEIPNSVTCINSATFGQCHNLSSIKIPNSVTIIGECAFDGCTSLTTIEIPNSVTTIGPAAFIDCSGLTSIEIPNSVTIIDEQAFCGCRGLTSIEIPNTVTYIGDSAFRDCNSIDDVYYNTTDPISTESLFSDITYKNAKLHVPVAAIDIFKETPCWCYFKSINPYGFSGVEEIATDFDSTLPYDVYDINGEYIGTNTEVLAPGIYILRQGKTVKKTVIK